MILPNDHIAALFRQCALALCAVFGLAVLCALVSPAAAMDMDKTDVGYQSGHSLKENSLVEGETLYLSDLFTGIQPHEDAVVGRAPKPGEKIEIPGATLFKLARVYNLSWRPASLRERVVLRRSARVIPDSDIKDGLARKLRDKGVDGTFRIHYLGKAPNITLPERLPQSFEIASFSFTPGTDRFKASIVAPSLDNAHARADIMGTVERLVDVPVLKKSLRNGTIITSADIKMVEMRLDTLNADVIIDPDRIIGMTPDRYLVSSKPIRKDDIDAPTLV